MKKLLLLLTTAFFVSCSSDDQITVKDSTAQNSLSVLDGNMLSFKDDKSFIEEYDNLTALSTAELKNWISSKKIVSLLNTSDDSVDMEDDVISDSRVIYSDAVKSILNSESKLKIGGKTLWLNGRNFYVLSEKEINKSSEELNNVKDNLIVYGQLLSMSGANTKSLTSRNTLPNENKSKTFITDMPELPNRLRHVLDLYNETIVLNDQIQSSKMFLRTTIQYRSCSTWRCTWKDDNSNIRNNFGCDFRNIFDNSPIWGMYQINDYGFAGSKTYLLSNWNYKVIAANSYPNFVVSGPVKWQVGTVWYSVDISWY